MTNKILIIQNDSPYFLYESLKTLEKSRSAIKDHEITVLASKTSIEAILSQHSPLVSINLVSDEAQVIRNVYDVSVNLSLLESSYGIHGVVQSKLKLGPFLQNGQIRVNDLWSTFLLTVKAQAPFLTFHLQDIYRNILGIKKFQASPRRTVPIREIVWGQFHPNFLSYRDFETLQCQIKASLPLNFVPSPSQVDLISDLSHTLYIGPASFEGVRLCEAGAQGIFIGSQFQGLNLLPRDNHHLFLSTRGEKADPEKLVPFIESYIKSGKAQTTTPYSVYSIEEDQLFGGHMLSLNESDMNYPAYQCHLVLWNFLLGLYDINLDVLKCSPEQIEQLSETQKVLNKLLRLHDYALSSTDTVFQAAKSTNASAEKIEGHLTNIREVEEVMANIARSHPLLRPFLDFYRIRRSQNDGISLLEQAEHSLLTYSEEHHALNALNELFSVTLRKNEVSI